MIDLGHYLIDADDRSVTLYRRRVSEKGEATTVVVGYYANLTAVARKLATLPTHEAIAARKTVTEIAQIVDRATATILEALGQTETPTSTVHPGQGALPC